LDLGRDLAAGLDYAHAAGGVHGDLRPGSVLLQPSGAAKVVDFGIAGALAASRLSHAVSLWDDPTYLAPEALTGGGGPAADLWALALLLYRALTGALPFDAADPAQLLEQIEGGIPRPPSTRDASLRPAVDLCFDRALDKRPEARFPSCEAFVAELAAALAEPRAPAARALVTQPLDAGLRRELTAAPIPRRAIPPARRRSRWPRLAALLAGLALGLGAGLGAMFLLRDGGAPPSATPAPSTAASPVPTATPPAPWGPPAVALPPPSAPSAPPTEPELRAAAPRSRSPAAEPTGTGETTAIRATVGAPATTRYGTLRVRLASEVPAGRLTVLLDSEPILTERFRFGGPFAFLRRRPRGGQLQLVRQVPAQPATLTVRLELGDRLEVVPLSAVWTEALELTLAIEVNAERGVTATLS
jgi:serine/threonine-protein kinase